MYFTLLKKCSYTYLNITGLIKHGPSTSKNSRAMQDEGKEFEETRQITEQP